MEPSRILDLLIDNRLLNSADPLYLLLVGQALFMFSGYWASCQSIANEIPTKFVLSELRKVKNMYSFTLIAPGFICMIKGADLFNDSFSGFVFFVGSFIVFFFSGAYLKEINYRLETGKWP